MSEKRKTLEAEEKKSAEGEQIEKNEKTIAEGTLTKDKEKMQKSQIRKNLALKKKNTLNRMSEETKGCLSLIIIRKK